MAGNPIWRRYARMFGPDHAADVNDELRFHIETRIDDLVDQGWGREDARSEAERLFGDYESIRQDGERLRRDMERSMNTKDYCSGWAQDFRFAWRTLRKDRGFALVTILILGLGIAANTAVFSVVNTVMLRPLPFPASERLVWLASGKAFSPAVHEAAGLSILTYTVDAYEEFQRHNKSFQQVAAYDPFLGDNQYTLTGRGEPQPIDGISVDGRFFQTLGVQPLMGSLFTMDSCRKGSAPVVVLSHAFWQRRLSADPSIIGRTITLSRTAYTVVGVLPPSFDFGSVFSPGTKIDLFVASNLNRLRNSGNTLSIVGRLKPGITVQQAQAEADILFPQLKAEHKDWWGNYASTLTGLKEHVTGKLRRSLTVLWSAVGLILLLVCVNLSNLMLTRATARGREFALRNALGAGRTRLLRQLLTESLLLSGAGALLGLTMAFLLTTWLARQGSIALPLLTSVKVDDAALLWTLLITLSVAILFGLAPAGNLFGRDLQSALKDGGHGAIAGRQHERTRTVLVISEVALASVLLVGAGLLLRSFLNVLDVDLGFQPSRAAVIKVDYDLGGKRERLGPVSQETLRTILAIPGVESAGITDMLPLGRNRSWGLRAKGLTYPKDQANSAIVRIITPGLLPAMGIRLQQGRDFTWTDTGTSDPVVIINQAAARHYWQGEDPSGRPAVINGKECRVVGVVADVREHGLEDKVGPEMYLPITQAGPEGAELVIRTSLPPSALAATVLARLRALNPAQPAADLRPLQHIVDRSVSPRRFFVLLVSCFGILGLILASLGIYGVISYSVTRQTQEIGIRMALGATAPQVQANVIAKALRLACAGAVIGAIASLATARWIESLLFGTKSADPGTFAAISLLLVAVALLAGFLPARRASQIDPMVALRNN